MFWGAYTGLIGGFAAVEADCFESFGGTLILTGVLLAGLSAFRRWRLYVDEPPVPEFEPGDPDRLIALDLRVNLLAASGSSQTA
jgi:hypothetical protein